MLSAVAIGIGLFHSARATGRMACGALIALAIVSGTFACAESRAPVSSTEPLAMRVEAFLVRGNLHITVVAEPSIFPATQTDLILIGANSRGPFLQEKLMPDPVKGTVEIRVDKARIPSGKIVLEATASNRQTGRKHQVKKELAAPLQPAWFGTTAGMSDLVPAPWTSLKVEGDTVKPWGRAYRFDRSPLPAGVLTRDASVLAGPIRLAGRASGRLIEWHGEAIRYTSRKPAVVSLTTRGSFGDLAFEGTAAVEYDGMVRVDLRLVPNPSPLVIDQLALEIPLKPEHARYLYHFPGQWGSVANSGYLPAGGWAGAFKPFVWLGDEDRGLAWFCESDRGWYPADPKRAITIDRQKNETILRCHLIDRPMPVKGPLQYTFGLQATPVKNPEKTVWDYRITHHGGYGLESQPATQGREAAITYPGAGHLRAEEGTFECWYRPALDAELAVPLENRKYRDNRDIFTVKWGDDVVRGTNCGLYWNYEAQGPVAWSRKDGKVHLNPRASLDWKAGQWHHLAMTWGKKVCIYVDGKLLSETENLAPGFVPAPPEKAVIEIGGRNTLATIDEVRILGVSRRPAPEPGPYTADAQTLLLDHFDDYRLPGVMPLGVAPPYLSFVSARFGKGPTWGPSQSSTYLQWLAEMGVRTICFHEHWSPYQSHPYATEENRPRLHRLIEACHREKIGLLLYMSRQLADNAPEWEQHSAEALQVPNMGIYERQPTQKAYFVCWNSPWKDFCLYHLDRLLAEFGHDGWYLDGPEWPLACANREHGCGYVAPDGTVRPTYDIFATRDFMKRLYVLTRQRKPEGQLNIHNSTVMVIPTLGWGTSSWGGEQLDAIKPPVKTLDVLPMDAFRTEFMGRPWGVPSEFLVYDGAPYFARDLLAYTLLHGVLIRPSSNEQIINTAALWKMYDAFPLKDAKLHPYWNNSDLLTCSPEGVYATAYERPGEGLLVFVSNLREQPAEARITVHADRLGWKGPIRSWDVLTNKPMEIREGTIRLPLAPWRYSVLRLKPVPIETPQPIRE